MKTTIKATVSFTVDVELDVETSASKKDIENKLFEKGYEMKSKWKPCTATVYGWEQKINKAN